MNEYDEVGEIFDLKCTYDSWLSWGGRDMLCRGSLLFQESTITDFQHGFIKKVLESVSMMNSSLFRFQESRFQ